MTTMKKKVLFVMDGMQVGGVERALISVFHYFNFDDCDCELFLLHDYDELLSEIDNRVKVKRLSSADKKKKPFSFLFWYAAVKLSLFSKRLKRYFSIKMENACLKAYGKQVLGKYDIVIAYKHGEAENFVADCVDCKEKILFYHHGSLIDEKLHERVIAKFDKTVAVSEGVRDLLQSRFPQIKNRLTVIPNYFDRDYIIRRANEYAVDKEEGTLTLCTVGRFSSEKRFDRVIECAKLLKQRGIKFIWYAIGDGSLFDQTVKACTDCGLKDHIRFTGSLINPLPYVAACDEYVQTSDVESYGLAMIEALALNKPVVSTFTIGGKLLKSISKNVNLSDFDPDNIVGLILKCNGKFIISDNNFFTENDTRISKLWIDLIG